MDKKIPLITNIIKKFRVKGDKYVLSSFCTTKGLGIKDFDINKIKITINNKEYPKNLN